MWNKLNQSLKEAGYIVLYGLFLILIAWWAYPIAWFYYRRKDSKTIQHDKEYWEKFKNVETN